MKHRNAAFFVSILGLASVISAQDSVSKSGCLPGDGVVPWQDATDPNGSEQGDEYIVDMSPFVSSWGNLFGAAPIIKTSKTDGAFFGSLPDASGMSRRQALGVPYTSSSYDSWLGAGFGINNDSSINDPGTPVDTSSAVGHQFAVALSEAGTLGAGFFQGIVSATVNVDPMDPSRLYVARRIAAINTCDADSDISQFGFGAIDEEGGPGLPRRQLRLSGNHDVPRPDRLSAHPADRQQHLPRTHAVARHVDPERDQRGGRHRLRPGRHRGHGSDPGRVRRDGQRTRNCPRRRDRRSVDVHR